MTMQNVSAGVANIATGAAFGALAGRIPEIARQIDFAAEMERTRVALETLGAQSPDVARMQRFIIALAGTTAVPNREVIRAAAHYNLHRMARGESLLPDDIIAWAKGFMRYSFMGIPDVDTYLADAQRLWAETQTS